MEKRMNTENKMYRYKYVLSSLSMCASSYVYSHAPAQHTTHLRSYYSSKTTGQKENGRVKKRNLDAMV